MVEGDGHVLKEAKELRFDSSLYTSAIKKQMEEEVYQEIKGELYETVILEAKEEIDKLANDSQMRELRNLTISGVVLAVFVGLLVNQVIELIGHYKPEMESGGLGITLIISFSLILIVAAIMLIWFVGKALKIIENYRK